MSQTFFQCYCSVCKSYFDHPREKGKNNHTRNYSNFLNCCGAPICDDCNQKWFRVRCYFCKEITRIHEIKHTCIHLDNFRKNHYLTWDNCVTHCISFTRLMQLPLYNQFLKWRDEYVPFLILNWQNINVSFLQIKYVLSRIHVILLQFQQSQPRLNAGIVEGLVVLKTLSTVPRPKIKTGLTACNSMIRLITLRLTTNGQKNFFFVRIILRRIISRIGSRVFTTKSSV